MTDMDRLGSAEDVKIAAGVHNTAVDAVALERCSRSIDRIAFGNPAKINPGAASSTARDCRKAN